jgi:hypothetical protein
MKEALEAVLKVIEYAEQNNLTNSQEFINFLDELNALSIKY